MVKVTLTQEDLDANPQFVTDGLKVGDELERPETKEEKKTRVAAEKAAIGAVKGTEQANAANDVKVPGTVVKEYVQNGLRYKRVVNETGGTVDVRA